jgi:hypothetical protein
MKLYLQSVVDRIAEVFYVILIDKIVCPNPDVTEKVYL